MTVRKKSEIAVSQSDSPDRQKMIAAPLEHLEYFVEWGGPQWVECVRRMIDKLGVSWFAGKRVVDVGCRRAKMSSLFALLGADVIGLDHNSDALVEAKAEIAAFGLEDKIQLHIGDATDYLSACEPEFDLIFTKSTLVVTADPWPVVAASVRSLRPDGHMFSIENGRGNALIHLLRRFRVDAKHFHRWHYFGEKHVARLVKTFKEFDVERVKYPPIYSIHCRNPNPAAIDW